MSASVESKAAELKGQIAGVQGQIDALSGAVAYAPGAIGGKLTAAKLQSLKISAALASIATFLRSTAISQDFVKNYSLSEAVQERLDLIGADGHVVTQSPRGLPTLMAELDALESIGNAAIEEAIKAATVAAFTDSELTSESTGDPDEDDVIISSDTSLASQAMSMAEGLA